MGRNSARKEQILIPNHYQSKFSITVLFLIPRNKAIAISLVNPLEIKAQSEVPRKDTEMHNLILIQSVILTHSIGMKQR